MSAAPQIKLKFPAKLQPMLKPMRFKVLHGGRGGGKSHTVAQLLLMLSMQRKLRILCVREVQKSLAESSMQVLKDYIERLGIEAFFTILKNEIRCDLTGSTFAFIGLKDHTKDTIKSWEGCDIVWAEEANRISANSWTVLIPTIRKADARIWSEKPNTSEIWATFNPDQETDYVYDRFVKHRDPDAIVIAINWRDNPWFGDVMEKERLSMKALNDDLYQHVWEGKCRTAAGLIFKRRWFKRYKLGEHPENLHKYISSDYAATDPDDEDVTWEPDWTEHGVAGLDSIGDMWFIDWWSGQTDPAVWIRAWLVLVKRHDPLIAFEEKGVILRSQNGAIKRAMRKEGKFVFREGLVSAGNKASRALGFAARAAEGTVWIPECDWGDRLINQLCAFNGQDGRTDDMVDVCSLFARGLDKMTDASLPPAETKPPPIKPFSIEWLEHSDKQDALDAEQRAEYYR